MSAKKADNGSKVRVDDVARAHQYLDAAKRSTVTLGEWMGVEFWRLAEVVQMKRQTLHSATGSTWYFECQLCLGRSSVEGQIVHKDYCPVERMKGG